MNDDEVRRQYHNAIANGDPRTRALAAECLRRGEVIATYEAALERYRLLPAIESDHDEPLLDEGDGCAPVAPMSDAERALLEGEAP